MISYAQNGEDVILARALGGAGTGFYVDVGAASPVEATVTRHFYEHGWRGINLEPVPAWAAALRALRPRDVTLEAAAGSAPGELVFFEVLDDPALSTTDRQGAARLTGGGHQLREVRVPVVTLDDVLAEVSPRSIDFLKVDVEGAEREVLLGIDLERWRPRVIVVEATEPNSLRPAYQAWEDLIVSKRYRYASTDGINRYYVRDEEAALAELLVPVNSLDDAIPMREQLLLDEIERLRVYAHSLEVGLQRRAEEVSLLEARLSSSAARTRLRLPGSNLAPPGPATMPPRPALERVAVLSSPGTGSLRFASAVAGALGCIESVAPHPADLRFDQIPERVVVHLVWQRSERLRQLLADHGFQVATVLRHPFDTLLAVLRLAAAEPAATGWLESGEEQALVGVTPLDEAFAAWATSPRAAALLAVSAGWWQAPGTWRVPFAALEADFSGEVARLRALFRPGDSSPIAAAPAGAFGLEEVTGGWRRYLPSAVAERLVTAHGTLLAELGEEVEVAGLPDAEQARVAWASLSASSPVATG